MNCCWALEQDGCDLHLLACAVLAKTSTNALSATMILLELNLDWNTGKSRVMSDKLETEGSMLLQACDDSHASAAGEQHSL